MYKNLNSSTKILTRVQTLDPSRKFYSAARTLKFCHKLSRQEAKSASASLRTKTQYFPDWFIAFIFSQILLGQSQEFYYLKYFWAGAFISLFQHTNNAYSVDCTYKRALPWLPSETLCILWWDSNPGLPFQRRIRLFSFVVTCFRIIWKILSRCLPREVCF
jgi:hypothetical protein